MICFLTSRTDGPTGALNPANGFVQRLQACFPASCRAVFLCSDPEGHARTDFFAACVKTSMEEAGFSFSRYTILDGRNEGQAAALLGDANFLILAGGHVPTQNRFFQKIGLRALLGGFNGVLIGISAGSMNSAEVVYAQPELDGEAADPAYSRFFPGLGLTETMILPHYQQIKDDVLDGLRVMEDIAYPDSMGRAFLVLVDGSYLYLDKGRETVCGEAYMLADGVLAQISAPGEARAL